jgi:putative membrane-bound dehydrogenase-like protein
MTTLATLLFLCATSADPAHGLRVPAGFEVTEFADARLAGDIHCLTIDPKGRVVVSGPGYLRVLLDDDGDGKADRALDFPHAPKDGAHGLHWEGDSLYCVGDGGLRLFRDADGKGRERPSELLFKCKTGGEHTAHAVRRGPDGWLYLLVGDHAGITKAHATLSTSPVKDPTGGCVLRFPPDFEGCEIVAHSFRNPYGMDWNADGDLFTFDSDNERCVSLPWYEPTRCYHVVPGGHHGWLAPRFTTTWRYPPYFPDVVAPVVTLGRGSPTGVVCYRHAQFPARYRGGLFLLDWTFGQIHFVQLARKGTSYEGKAEVFLKSVGDNGFAPTAAAVHPRTGDLYVSIGGRGTRGAVYRIRHPAGLKSLDRREVAKLRLQPSEPAAQAKVSAPGPLTDVRSAQKALGDIGAAWAKGTVWEGYSRRSADAKLPDKVRTALRDAFPSRDQRLDYELARTLAMTEDDDPALLARVAAKLTPASHPVDDIHYLIALARLKAPRSASLTQTTAAALLSLDRKLDERRLNRDTNWPLRIAELHAGLAERDPSLNKALLAHRDFGRPDHAMFCRAKGFDRKAAAEVFLARSAKDEAFAWNADLVALLGALPPERSRPVLRKLRGEAGLDDALLPLLAKHAEPSDYDWFVLHLDSPRLATVGLCLDVLERFPHPSPDQRSAEALKLMLALRNLPPGKEEDKLRTRALKRLSNHAGRQLPTFAAALDWYRKAHPDRAARLESPDGVDVAAWQKRLVTINWDKGDAKRGMKVYTRASCASCHSGVAALGPDLRGVTGRFSRDDLFTAILQPSKDVSPRYRTTQLTTLKGQVYQGIIVYEAVDSVLMLTGPSQSVRLGHAQIAERKLTATSLMPAGLLDPLKDEEIADLFAYLKSPGADK